LIARSAAGLLALTVSVNQGGLPDQIRRTLAQRFPGWAFATVAPDYGPGTSAAWIAVDFDGDGRMDYAVQLVAPSSGGVVQRVVVFLQRGRAYTLVPLDSFPPTTTVYLQRVPKGAVRRDFDVHDARARTFQLAHDAVQIVYDDQAAKTCWYTAPGFHCAWTGD
jgi:hypothetical protein